MCTLLKASLELRLTIRCGALEGVLYIGRVNCRRRKLTIMKIWSRRRQRRDKMSTVTIWLRCRYDMAWQMLSAQTTSHLQGQVGVSTRAFAEQIGTHTTAVSVLLLVPWTISMHIKTNKRPTKIISRRWKCERKI